MESKVLFNQSNMKPFTAEKLFESNLDTFYHEGLDIPDGVKKAAIQAIHEFASFHCYQLLTDLIACKYGNGNPEGVKFRYEWLRDNII